VSEEKDRIRQIALDKFEAGMCGDRDFSRVPMSPFHTLPGDNFGLNEAIRYFPKFLHNALRRVFQFPEAVRWTKWIVVEFDDEQNSVARFNKECESCILLVNNILEALLLHNPQEELDFLDKYESWCEKAKKQLKDELATMEKNEKMSLSLVHRSLKLKKERNALAEQLQIFVDRIIGRIARKIEWDQNRDQRRKETKRRKLTSQQAKPVEEANNAKKGLTKAEILAYQSYDYAITQKPELANATDNKVYDWLKEYGTGEDDYELPYCETWKRQVRAGRKHHGMQKNTPRSGRTSRSIVTVNQIKYTSSQKAD